MLKSLSDSISVSQVYQPSSQHQHGSLIVWLAMHMSRILVGNIQLRLKFLLRRRPLKRKGNKPIMVRKKEDIDPNEIKPREYRDFIILALAKLGGSGTKRQVFELLDEWFKDKF